MMQLSKKFNQTYRKELLGQKNEASIMESMDINPPQMNEIIHVENLYSKPNKPKLNLKSIEENKTAENRKSSTRINHPGIAIKVSKFGEESKMGGLEVPSLRSANQSNTLYTNRGDLSPSKTHYSSNPTYTKSQWNKLGNVATVGGKAKRAGKRLIDKTIKKYFGE